MITQHELKTWPEFFEAMHNASKTFELRYNDRNYQSGDMLYLREFQPCRYCQGKGQVEVVIPMRKGYIPEHRIDKCMECMGEGGEYTGRVDWYAVTYILSDHPGIYRGYVIMGLVPDVRVHNETSDIA